MNLNDGVLLRVRTVGLILEIYDNQIYPSRRVRLTPREFHQTAGLNGIEIDIHNVAIDETMGFVIVKHSKNAMRDRKLSP